jgi:hypothetical protein
MTSFCRGLMVAAACSLIAGRAAPQSRSSAPGKTRQLFVSVSTATGSPVLDLGPADFDVQEGGEKRTVVHAALATTPMRIALMVDTSDAAASAFTHMRSGLLAFLDALSPEQEVVLITTGRQMRVRVPPTADRKKLKDAAGGLFPDGAGTPLMDSLLDADARFMRKADDRWPVFVIVTSDGTESTPGARDKEFNQWIDGLRSRAATVHAIVLKVKDGSGVPEIVASNATKNTGGRFESIVISNALPDKLKVLGEQLTSDYRQMSTNYQVEFLTDTAGPLASVNVGVARSGVKMQLSYQRRFP